MTRFVDASYYIAAVNPRDSLHAAAYDLASRLEPDFITTEYVLLEVANWLADAGDRAVFLRLYAQLREDLNTTILQSDPELFSRGLALYAARPDKDWSLTDCVSFVVMEEWHIREALTADQHFRQAGFTIMLK
jgi:uncharacterized protein